MAVYSVTINGLTHTVQASSVEEAARFGHDPELVSEKAAEKPANKARAPRNKQG